MKVNFVRCKWLPTEYELAIVDELRSLGLDIVDKIAPAEKIDDDAELLIINGYGSAQHFYTKGAFYKDKDKGKKVVFNVWDVPEHRFIAKYRKNLVLNFLNFIGDRPTVCYSTSVKETLAKYGIEAEVQLSYFTDRIIESLPDVKRQDRIVTNVRLVPTKNHAGILMALSLLPINIPWLIMAPKENSYGDVLKAMAEKMNKKVEFKFGLAYEKVLREVKASRLMVTPSFFEGFGITPKEALWAGVPVITSNIDPFVEFHGDTIPMCDPGNFIELSKLIMDVWENGIDIKKAKEKIKPLTVHNQAVKFIDYLKRKKLI